MCFQISEALFTLLNRLGSRCFAWHVLKLRDYLRTSDSASEFETPSSGFNEVRSWALGRADVILCVMKRAVSIQWSLSSLIHNFRLVCCAAQVWRCTGNHPHLIELISQVTSLHRAIKQPLLTFRTVPMFQKKSERDGALVAAFRSHVAGANRSRGHHQAYLWAGAILFFMLLLCHLTLFSRVT